MPKRWLTKPRLWMLGATSVMLMALVIGLRIAVGQEADRIPLGLPRDIGAPVVNDQGEVLVGIADGANAVVARISEGQTSPKRTTALTVEGLVDSVQLAASFPHASEELSTLAVVVSCPDRFLDPEPDFENAKVCSSNSEFLSFQLDSQGKRITEPIALPAGVRAGRLFATHNAFIWAWSAPQTGVGPAKPERALYFDGAWHPFDTDPPSDTPAIDQCTTPTDLWVLHGNSGPRSLEGSDNAQPNENVNFGVFRYSLVEPRGANSWVQVAVPGLESSSFAELACGRREAYISFDDRLYAMGDQVELVDGVAGDIYSFVDNRALNPVVFVARAPGDSQCALLDGSKLVVAGDPPGSADQNRISVCDGVPWKISGRYVSLYLDPQTGELSISQW